MVQAWCVSRHRTEGTAGMLRRDGVRRHPTTHRRYGHRVCSESRRRVSRMQDRQDAPSATPVMAVAESRELELVPSVPSHHPNAPAPRDSRDNRRDLFGKSLSAHDGWRRFTETRTASTSRPLESAGNGFFYILALARRDDGRHIATRIPLRNERRGGARP